MDDSPPSSSARTPGAETSGDPAPSPGATAPNSGATARRPGLAIALAVTALLVITADQVTKLLAVRHLTEGLPVTVIGGWLQLNLIRNPGAAFSLATGSTWIFTVIAIVVSVVIVRISRQLGSRWWAVALGLLLGGALGNLSDRLFRQPGFARGHVVDFIQYLRFPVIDFPIFNVADSCIVVAAALIGVLGVRGVGIDGSRVAD